MYKRVELSEKNRQNEDRYVFLFTRCKRFLTKDKICERVAEEKGYCQTCLENRVAIKRCEECWGNYRVIHKCDPIIRRLVQVYKNSKRYRHVNRIMNA